MGTNGTAISSNEEHLRGQASRQILERLDRAFNEEGAEQREPQEKELRRARHRELVKGEW